MKFKIGDYVEKTGGDYSFVGRIVAAFQKLAGQDRYVVENNEGILHIYSEKNLKFQYKKITKIDEDGLAYINDIVVGKIIMEKL